MKKKKFALLGVGGFVAPRNLKAIKENDGELIASCDVVDSVGIIDSYFPNSYFFNNFNGFEKFISEVQSTDNKIDYLVICTPNYLHHSHIRFGVLNDMHVICEKPLLINVNLLNNLFKLKKKYNKEIYCILQLRMNDKIYELKKRMNKRKKFAECFLTYNTPRGRWYDYSWKGDFNKSGGILYNIGIHLFDILIWIFGKYNKFEIYENDKRSSSGKIYFNNASVKWNLSINLLYSDNFKSERKLLIDDESFEITGNFSNSHSVCYDEILKNNNILHAESTVDSLLLASKMAKYE